ncbi:MAG: helix-turn-helix transcriptional regulator [Bacteroides sp.]|nr:helix-turn-helix transcriptional regulator [Bacteroides sp.]
MIESLTEFYKRIERPEMATLTALARGKEFFNVQESVCQFGTTSFSYRDFYKVSLVMHTGRLYYADKWIEVDRPAILFSTPLIPYAWENTGMGRGNGYFCIFNELFLKPGDRNSSLAETPLLDISKERIYFLDDNTVDTIQDLFIKMKKEMESDYAQKSDMLRCYLHLIVHEVMKMQQVNHYVANKNASQRIAELFLALLERQFPVDSRNSLSLKTANDFARRLSVHVNHLNRVVKSTTGRTTSSLISNRITQEAVQLLQHSDYSIAEIAFALGFEEPASFSSFLKKHTDMSPTEHRVKAVAV